MRRLADALRRQLLLQQLERAAVGLRGVQTQDAPVGAEAKALHTLVGTVRGVVTGPEPRDLLLGQEVTRRCQRHVRDEREDAVLRDQTTRLRERRRRVVLVVGELRPLELVSLDLFGLVGALEARLRTDRGVAVVRHVPDAADLDRAVGDGHHSRRRRAAHGRCEPRGHEAYHRGDEYEPRASFPACSHGPPLVSAAGAAVRRCLYQSRRQQGAPRDHGVRGPARADSTPAVLRGTTQGPP